MCLDIPQLKYHLSSSIHLSSSMSNLNVCVFHLPSSKYCSVNSTRPSLVIPTTMLDRVPYRPYTVSKKPNLIGLDMIACLRWWEIWERNVTHTEMRSDMHYVSSIWVAMYSGTDDLTPGLSNSTKIGERACSHSGETPVDGNHSCCGLEESCSNPSIMALGGRASCAYWPRSEDSFSLARTTCINCKRLQVLYCSMTSLKRKNERMQTLHLTLHNLWRDRCSAAMGYPTINHPMM